MPLIDPHAKTSWVALFCLVLVGAVGAVVFEQLALAAVLAAVACAGLVVTAAVGAVRFVAAHAGRMRRFPLPSATPPCARG